MQLYSFQAHTSAINRIKQSPYNYQYVAAVTGHNTAKIWNVTSSSSSSYDWFLIRNYTPRTYPVNDLEFIDEDTIATGSHDRLIKNWSISTGITVRIIRAGSVIYSLVLASSLYLDAGL
jgi:WD40 repeat protein